MIGDEGGGDSPPVIKARKRASVPEENGEGSNEDDLYLPYLKPNYKRLYPENSLNVEFKVFIESKDNKEKLGNKSPIYLNHIFAAEVKGVVAIRRINANKITAIFKQYNTANNFLNNTKFMEKYNMKAYIPAAQIERTGIIRDVRRYWTDMWKTDQEEKENGGVTRVHVERTNFSEIPVIKCEIHTNFHNNQLNDSAFEISVKQPPTDASERVLCPLSSRYAAQRTSGSARRAMNRKNARRSATRHAARWRSIRGLGQSIAASHTLVTALDSEWLHVYMLYVYLEIVVEVSDDECCITKCMYMSSYIHTEFLPNLSTRFSVKV
ncbi:hypothetical protein MSG28_000134 [Choristoneura fumiferana]|uniref:Uncharacterized protein n=1 Tax=Choristoneura fumiferana TaxID=7141 RepID=A0ACC0JZA2_CHOFU|nr:hypothetical protein MSG28_000134 [Choristoneura fumiferana]